MSTTRCMRWDGDDGEALGLYSVKIKDGVTTYPPGLSGSDTFTQSGLWNVFKFEDGFAGHARVALAVQCSRRLLALGTGIGISRFMRAAPLRGP